MKTTTTAPTLTSTSIKNKHRKKKQKSLTRPTSENKPSTTRFCTNKQQRPHVAQVVKTRKMGGFLRILTWALRENKLKTK